MRINSPNKLYYSSFKDPHRPFHGCNIIYVKCTSIAFRMTLYDKFGKYCKFLFCTSFHAIYSSILNAIYKERFYCLHFQAIRGDTK